MVAFDSVQFLRTLVGKEIRTARGRPNRVLRIDGDKIVVATTPSPEGRPVPLKWATDAIENLRQNGEVEVSVASLGYRSAFVGAVLLQLTHAELVETSPPRVRLFRVNTLPARKAATTT
jgi:hypothetical protein